MAHTRVRPIFLLALLVCVGASLVIADSGPNHQSLQTGAIQLGTSGGNVNNHSSAFCCSGTLGALVTKGGVNYILSNNHVLADSDTASVGDDISQPGLVDTLCGNNAFNVVADFSEAPPLGTQNVDAALAEARSGMVDGSGAILDVGVPASTEATPTVGRGVAKSGRTTGFTCGSIGSINTNVSVQYQRGCNQGKKFTITYINQVVVNSSSFSAGGDSGSLIVTSDTSQPVALLYAGSSSSTIGNPIGDVTSALEVTFVGGATHATATTCPSGGGGGGGGGNGHGHGHGHGATLPQQAIDNATAVKDRFARGLMADPAVLGVGVGEHPDNPGEAVLVVYVETGRMLGRPIPSQIGGVRTVVVKTEPFRAYGWNEQLEPKGSCSAK